VATGVLLVLGVTGRLVRNWVAGGAPAHRTVTNGIGMELTWVPAGEFTMGSPADEPGRREDEGPTRRVTISRPFYVAVHETTVAQFRAFADALRYRTEAEDRGAGAQRWDAQKGAWVQDAACTWRNPGWTPQDDEPVVCVSRRDAALFCYWLGKKEGRVYRLPKEAEWEYACRAGVADTHRQAQGGPPGAGRPARVGSIPANAWGLFDLHGNVWQWCADYYSPTYYQKGPTQDPLNQKESDLGVLRGGSWHGGPGDCRCAARLGVPPGARRTDVGFRVVMEAGVR
jgi:formylglycine-generating enzyme required for sulfatase activity